MSYEDLKMDNAIYQQAIKEARKSKMKNDRLSLTKEELIALGKEVQNRLNTTYAPITRDIIQLTNPSSEYMLAKIQGAEREGYIVEVLYQAVATANGYTNVQHCYTLIVKENV